MNLIKKLVNRPDGIQVSVTLGGVKSGWSFFKKMFGRTDKEPSLESEWDQDYINVIRGERDEPVGEDKAVGEVIKHW